MFCQTLSETCLKLLIGTLEWKIKTLTLDKDYNPVIIRGVTKCLKSTKFHW